MRLANHLCLSVTVIPSSSEQTEDLQVPCRWVHHSWGHHHCHLLSCSLVGREVMYSALHLMFRSFPQILLGPFLLNQRPESLRLNRTRITMCVCVCVCILLVSTQCHLKVGQNQTKKSLGTFIKYTKQAILYSP